jgi:hypothetical protein
MRHELGEISEREYVALEGELLARIRQVRERQREPGPSLGAFRVTGIDVSAVVVGDDAEDERRGVDLPAR